MFKNLWKRTKHVASTYTGTFIVVMLLNQLLFFGFCLNPICLVAAMPHVLLITVAVGSWINKASNWGARKIEEETPAAILAHIKAINSSVRRVIPKPAGSRRPLDGMASTADKHKKRNLSTKRLPIETPHKFGETPDEFLREFHKKNPISDKRINIKAQAEDFKIPHLVHFTRCENLPSILRHGLLSVEECEAKDICTIRNDSLRLDAQPDGISLSIAFPNYRMFYKYRKLDIAAGWAVLILSPKLLWEKNCGFYRYNAADSRMHNLPRWKATSPEAFRKMFETPDAHREHWLRPYDPTDPQAEVMVYEKIEAKYIETIAFETKAAAEKWRHVLGGIETIYAGQGKGLFASRAQVRQN